MADMDPEIAALLEAKRVARLVFDAASKALHDALVARSGVAVGDWVRGTMHHTKGKVGQVVDVNAALDRSVPWVMVRWRKLDGSLSKNTNSLLSGWIKVSPPEDLLK